MIETFIQYLILYFVVIDPIGTVPLFIVVTKGLKNNDKISLLIFSQLKKN